MKTYSSLAAIAILGLLTSGAMADSFGSGANQFTMDFVHISGDASGVNGTSMGPATSQWAGFADPGYDYRMGAHEVTADQYNKFVASAGAPSGYPSSAYDDATTATGDRPADNCSWIEAARFVNWLNGNAGAGPAYNFVWDDTNGWTFDVWPEAQAATTNMWVGQWVDGAPTGSVQSIPNLYRHKDAKYFLPTEDEWVKAGYWNGTSLQTYTTVGDVAPVAGVDAQYGTPYPWPQWDVGSGTAEVNGTYDMAGNIEEFVESPNTRDGTFSTSTSSAVTRRGGQSGSSMSPLEIGARNPNAKNNESEWYGFRVAAVTVGALPGDLDGDGDIDADDVNLLCANMGGDPAIYDMDGDGDVDEDDMIFHVENYLEYDTNGDGIIDGSGTFRGDFNTDGAVNGTDLSIMSGGFGTTTGFAGGNANCDATVNGTDLSILSSVFGNVATAAVPEPLTMSLLSLGAVALLRKRT